MTGAEFEYSRDRPILTLDKRMSDYYFDKRVESVSLDESERKSVVHFPVLEIEHDFYNCLDQCFDRELFFLAVPSLFVLSGQETAV